MAEHDKEAVNMTKRFDYDSENDILTIHKGFEKGESFKGNIDAGDIILDLSTNQRIRGIEIINAKRFFAEIHSPIASLSKIKGADFSATIKPSGIMINMIISSGSAEVPANIALPLNEQIAC